MHLSNQPITWLQVVPFLCNESDISCSGSPAIFMHSVLNTKWCEKQKPSSLQVETIPLRSEGQRRMV